MLTSASLYLSYALLMPTAIVVLVAAALLAAAVATVVVSSSAMTLACSTSTGVKWVSFTYIHAHMYDCIEFCNMSIVCKLSG